jgi:putative endonuclease
MRLLTAGLQVRVLLAEPFDSPHYETSDGAFVLSWGSLTASPGTIELWNIWLPLGNRQVTRKAMDIMNAWFYILRLKSSVLYSGSTKKLEQRVKDHFSGQGCRTTRLDPPVGLVYSEEFETYGQARARENQVKRWTRAKKEALVAGDIETLRKLSKRRRG